MSEPSEIAHFTGHAAMVTMLKTMLYALQKTILHFRQDSPRPDAARLDCTRLYLTTLYYSKDHTRDSIVDSG